MTGGRIVGGGGGERGDRERLASDLVGPDLVGSEKLSSDGLPSDGLPSDGLLSDGNVPWQPIDLLLNQGSADEIASMRNEVARDPMRALELADTVALVEQFRHLRVESSPEFAGKLQDVGLHGDRFCRSHYEPKVAIWRGPLVACLAAVMTFCLLWWLDADQLIGTLFQQAPDTRLVATLDEKSGGAKSSAPGLSHSGPGTDGSDAAAKKSGQAPIVAGGQSPNEEMVSREELSWERTVLEIASRLDHETSDHLRDAFRTGIQAAADPLQEWLDPRNALVLLRLDHELRANAEVRAEALRSRGTLTEVDDRVQELANALTREMVAVIDGASRRRSDDRDGVDLDASTRLATQVQDVAWAMRALIGAGPTPERDRALEQAGGWLVAKLPTLYGSSLVGALSGVVELATVTGLHFDAVGEHGQRLLDEVLRTDDETWSRRRPVLLAGRVDAGVLGEAGRILARLPAFGANPMHCSIVRRLALGQLRERRSLGQDRPEVLAAMVYGYGDLLNVEQNERDRLAWALRRWKPTRLAPDFRTVQQIAWSLTPGSRGFTRLQRELRQLAVLPEPQGMHERAAFCLCLATNYAGFVGNLLRNPPVRGS